MSNPRHTKPSPGDIPPARRQPADISLEEIEKASARPQPKKKRRSRSFVLIAIAALASAAAIWQRELVVPATARAYSKASTGLANVSGRISQRIAKRSPAEPLPTESPTRSTPVDTDPAAATGEDNPKALIIGPYPTDAQEGTSAQSKSPSNERAEPDTLLNHRQYDEASQSELVRLNPNSDLKLQPAAQASVEAMLNKARIEGVKLSVISAFRTIEDQDFLYFKIKAERGQTAKTRAAVSAPPGYSEHHTGYAVDFIDASRPDTQLSQSFETTAAFKWLVKNAAYFNFEMSFPKDGDSAVSYEPWHWRYVGDQKSLETFYKSQPSTESPAKPSEKASE